MSRFNNLSKSLVGDVAKILAGRRPLGRRAHRGDGIPRRTLGGRVRRQGQPDRPPYRPGSGVPAEADLQDARWGAELRDVDEPGCSARRDVQLHGRRRDFPPRNRTRRGHPRRLLRQPRRCRRTRKRRTTQDRREPRGCAERPADRLGRALVRLVNPDAAVGRGEHRGESGSLRQGRAARAPADDRAGHPYLARRCRDR